MDKSQITPIIAKFAIASALSIATGYLAGSAFLMHKGAAEQTIELFKKQS